MNIFKIDFDDEEIYFRKSDDVLFNDNDIADMLAQADTVIKDENENPERRAQACVKKYQLLETRYKLAPKLLEKALELFPDMPQTLTNMGRFFVHMKQREKALEYFNKAADADPSYPYVWLEKAYFAKDRDEEIYFYTRFIELKPNSKTGYERRVAVYYRIATDNNIEAFEKIPAVQRTINDYSALLRFDPSNYEYYKRRAEMHFIMEKANNIYGVFYLSINHDALKDIEQLLLLYPKERICNCITVVNNMFNWLKLSKETDIEYIKKIIDDMPKDSIALVIAQILLASRYEYDEVEKAIEIYSEIINALKEGSLLHIYCLTHRADLYLWKKEFEKALADNALRLKYISLLSKEERRLSSLECDPYYARRDRAQIYEEMTDFSGAINEYNLLIEELDNNDDKINISEAYFNRAGLFWDSCEYDKALADYLAVIDLGVTGFEYSIKDAYANRIKIFKIRGEMDKAFADYLKMSELKDDDDLSCSLEVIVPLKYEILDE